MILREYPEIITGIKENFIIHFVSGKCEIDKHVSPLSIKCSMKGSENFKTSFGNYCVTPGSYFIMNEGLECESVIHEESESFSLYFDTEFASNVFKSLINSGDKIIDYSYFPKNLPFNFFEKLYPNNNILSPLIMKLHLASKVNYDDSNWINEHFYFILEKLLIIHKNLYEEISKLPPVKLSTKIEIYKRICRAKEFMDSCYAKPINLESISKEACLSQFHFLRLFKSIYKKTPHQYLTGKRLGKAFNLLSETDKSITDICFETGYESMGSFSTLVKKNFGLSPEMLRNEFRKYLPKNKISY
ncbi:MAG TPA: AraC family transcriptional regulator [Ignavibacteria bacterium]|nr:AraC family transcriptional regulator [Ignavibacteria bacterium]